MVAAKYHRPFWPNLVSYLTVFSYTSQDSFKVVLNKTMFFFASSRSDRIEREAFYIEKFRDYLLSKDLMARVEAKFTSVRKALGDGNWTGHQGSR